MVPKKVSRMDRQLEKDRTGWGEKASVAKDSLLPLAVVARILAEVEGKADLPTPVSQTASRACPL